MRGQLHGLVIDAQVPVGAIVVSTHTRTRTRHYDGVDGGGDGGGDLRQHTQSQINGRFQ